MSVVGRLLVLAFGVTAWACDNPVAVACPAFAVAGLDVRVLSAATSEPICDATVTAVAGGRSEVLAPIGCRYQGAYESPGTYTVRGERAGFAAVALSGVRVIMGSGQCPHVQTVTVELRLPPLSAP